MTAADASSGASCISRRPRPDAPGCAQSLGDPRESAIRDHFPTTLRTAIAGWITGGDRAALNRHLFAAYYDPLSTYLRASRWFQARCAAAQMDAAAATEELHDILHSFLADRLGRSDYLPGWQQSGKRLSQYLRGGLWLHIKERRSEQARDNELTEIRNELAAIDARPDRALDREFVRNLVLQAMRTAQERCARKGLGLHWSVLVRHLCDGEKYAVVAKELGVPPDRAAVMLRTASSQLERAFLELVREHVASPQFVRRAIESFLEVIEP